MILLNKKFPKTTLLLLIIVAFVTCSKEKKEDPYIAIKQTSIFFDTSPNSKTINVESNIIWTATVSEDAKNWLSVSKQTQGLKITATENTSINARKGIIRLKGQGVTHEITVSQQGVQPEILVSQEIFTVASEGGQIIIETQANSDYSLINTSDWITITSLEEDTNIPLIRKYTLEIAWNKTSKERKAEVLLKFTDIDNFEKKITILQKPITAYSGNVLSGIKDDIKIPIISGKASSFQGGETIEKSFDANYQTIYHSAWNNSSPSYFPITLEYNFAGDKNIEYLIYHPRQGGNHNGNFKEVEIWANTTENDIFQKVTDFDFKGSSTATKLEFSEPIINAKTIRIVVKSGAGDGQGFAACSEMEFYQKNPENFDPLTIFTDITCSDLKPEITESDIEKIPNTFYRTIAYHMLKKEYPREFRIQEYKAWPHPNAIATKMKTWPYSLLDNPTGISVTQGQELIVFVGETHGQNISIKIQDLNKPGGDGYSQASTYPIAKGINKITTRNNGLIYVFYHSPSYQTLPKIKIHFATGNVNGYYDSQKHTSTDWQRLLSAANYEYFDVIGTHAHLTFPTQSYRNITGSRGPELIEAYDEMVKLQQDFMGLDKYKRPYVNRAYFHVIYKSYMYAISHRTAYNISTLNGILNVDTFRKSPWGPAHELGHIHQTRPGFLWHGMTEVSNNVHSLYIQTTWGNQSRIETEKIGNDFNNRYEKAYYNSFVENFPYATAPDVFCRLISLWQLHLYFAKVKGNEDFYKDLYEKIRINPNPKNAHGAAQLNFVKMVCEVSQTDLTDFFKKWGYFSPVDTQIDDYGMKNFVLTQTEAQEIISQIKNKNLPKPTAPIEYISDGNWEIFKKANPIIKGTATKSGNKITMQNWKNVVAFEVYEDEKLIFASNKEQFTLKKLPQNSIKVYAIAYDGTKTEVVF